LEEKKNTSTTEGKEDEKIEEGFGDMWILSILKK